MHSFRPKFNGLMHYAYRRHVEQYKQQLATCNAHLRTAHAHSHAQVLSLSPFLPPSLPSTHPPSLPLFLPPSLPPLPSLSLSLSLSFALLLFNSLSPPPHLAERYQGGNSQRVSGDIRATRPWSRDRLSDDSAAPTRTRT
jgi:hypothetical protein